MWPTSICEGLDVVRQVDVHTLRVLHFLEDDPNEPHGHKVVPVTEKQKQQCENSGVVVTMVTTARDQRRALIYLFSVALNDKEYTNEGFMTHCIIIKWGQRMKPRERFD